MTEILKPNKKTKKQEAKRPPCTKQNKKNSNLVQITAPIKQTLNHGLWSSWVCKNSACRASLSTKDTFCKRCSCCICHLFDDNKDPSLWFVCASESDDSGEYCGLSCHIECALKNGKIGAVDVGQLMQIDANYCCASCGKISGILECWKKQLNIAKDARRLDVLCQRIYLSYRLLEGTSRYKDLHEIVIDAKSKLEAEIGPLNGKTVNMSRGLVSRLGVASNVQKLCHLAIEKANELSVTNSSDVDHRDSLPAACMFLFEEVSPTTVKIRLSVLPGAKSDYIKGYKLWYYKSRGEKPAKEPDCDFQRSRRRVFVSGLQPCTEYVFRVVSYSEKGDLGHSEAKCFTKSVDLKLLKHRKVKTHVVGSSSEGNMNEELPVSGLKEKGDLPPVFKIRDLGSVLHLSWHGEEEHTESFCNADADRCLGLSSSVKHRNQEPNGLPTKIIGLDLNVASVPDLNETFMPPLDSSRDEDDAASHDSKKDGTVKCNGHSDSQKMLQMPEAEPPAMMCRKHALKEKEEAPGSDSTLMTNGSPIDSVGLDYKTFNYCVRVIRWLECEGHLTSDYRLKFLSWFSLRSSAQEQKVVNTFVQTLIDDPCSLAGQLADAFAEVIGRKRQRVGFC